MRALRSVGRARASSNALVCRLWVPPRTAESAWTVVLTMLFSACCAVSEEPAVWVWNLSFRLLSTVAHDLRPHPPGRPVLGHLLEQVVVRIEEEREPGRELVHLEPGVDSGLDICYGVGEGES